MGFFDVFKSKSQEPPVLNVSMMGPRSVGKTTVMTSIFSETQSSIAGSKLYLRSMDLNTDKLVNYHTMLVDAVEKGNAANLPASNTESSFKFGLGLLGQQPKVMLNVQDFPGEHLISKPSEVNNYMSNSTVVLIAIDTPYLMEDNGMYNNQKNKIDVVTKYLKDNASVIKNKLVLFVPLKCERYMHDGRIDEVSSAVECAYAELITSFKNNDIASYITPIITLGGIEFDRMNDNTTGVGDVEKLAAYRTYTTAPKYQPLFCPQPLYYLLSYVVNVYKWNKAHKKADILSRIMNMFYSFFDNDSIFFEEVKKLNRNILNGRAGYKCLTSNTITSIN